MRRCRQAECPNTLGKLAAGKAGAVRYSGRLALPDAQFSWNVRIDKAIPAGISAEVIKAVAGKRTPDFRPDGDRVFYTPCMEILNNHFMCDAAFEEARKIFGNNGIVDIIGCVGNFPMPGMSLNTAQMDLQKDRAPPIADVSGHARITAPARSSG